jgi:hypothetical protein
VGPCAFFSQIEFPEDLTSAGVAEALRANRDRNFWGGMSAEDYQHVVFTRPMDEWPIGHLLDHRVSMPVPLAKELLNGSPEALEGTLRHFLFSLALPDKPVVKQDAVAMVQFAVGCDPAMDAQMLQDLGRRSPDFAIALLCGRLRQARGILPSRVLRRSEVNQTIATMLVYYGALELQLIAARLRAIARFGFGVSSPSKEPALGGLLTGWKDTIEAIEYANKTVNGARPAGRTPRLIKLLHWKAKNIQRSSRLSDDEWLAALAPLLAELAEPLMVVALPAIEAYERTAETNYTAAERKALIEDKVQPPEKNLQRQPVDARMSMTTAMYEESVARQLAFASLRLESLVRHAPALAAKKRFTALDFQEFNSLPFLEGPSNPSLDLLFVYQTLVIEHPALVLRSASEDLCKRLEQYPSKDNDKHKALTTLKDVRAQRARFLKDRTVASQTKEHPLTGPQHFDILPDYRLEVRATLPAKSRRRGRGIKGNDKSSSRQRYEIGALSEFLYRPPPPRLAAIKLDDDPFGAG